MDKLRISRPNAPGSKQHIWAEVGDDRYQPICGQRKIDMAHDSQVRLVDATDAIHPNTCQKCLEVEDLDDVDSAHNGADAVDVDVGQYDWADASDQEEDATAAADSPDDAPPNATVRVTIETRTTEATRYLEPGDTTSFQNIQVDALAPVEHQGDPSVDTDDVPSPGTKARLLLETFIDCHPEALTANVAGHRIGMGANQAHATISYLRDRDLVRMDEDNRKHHRKNTRYAASDAAVDALR